MIIHTAILSFQRLDWGVEEEVESRQTEADVQDRHPEAHATQDEPET